MNNKKFKKLIRDPKRFFEDSKIIKFIGKKKSINQYKSTTGNKGTSLNLVGKKVSAERHFDFDVFINKIYPEIPCFSILAKNTRSSICVLNKDIYSFYKLLAKLSIEDNLIIAYNLNGRLTRPKSYEELLNHLENKRLVEFKISDRVSKNSVYFLLEIWNKEDGYVLAPKANMISRRVFIDVIRELYNTNLEKAPDLAFIYDFSIEDKVDFDIDYVFTWVNSEDKDWQKVYSQYKPDFNNDGNSLSRFKNREELKFSLRSLEQNAPWLRYIYIVSNCKPPLWLNEDHPKIRWVYHEEIFSKEQLPTFSSHAIESRLHKIAGLSNYFIYSNDDFFLARPATKEDFFLSNGLAKIRFEPWGNVNGELKEGDPDYLNAARNCQKLLEKDFKKSTSQLHTHSPQSMNKNVLIAMEEKYKEHFDKTAGNKFRHISDIAVTGYLFHHFAYLSGMGVKDYTRTYLIQQNHDFKKIFNNLLNEKSKVEGNLPLSFCINDGANSHLNDEWNESSIEFLEQYFSSASSFEK